MRNAHLYRLDGGTDFLAAELHHPKMNVGPFTAGPPDGLTTFDGLPFLAGEALPPGRWSKALAAMLGRHAPDDVQHRLRGAYTLCHYDATRTIRAFGDFAGLFPLFYLQSPEYVAISNRQSMLAGLHRASPGGDFDHLAMSWLTGQTMVCGDRSPHLDVRALPTGSHIAISPAGVLRVARLNRQFWHPGDGYRPLRPDDFDRAASALRENYEALASMPVPSFSMSLTGGKDSRLNLAGVLGTGLHLRLSETFTWGPPDSPEIECAAALAAASGVPHNPIVSRSSPSMDTVWRRLRQHVYRFEASVCPWDGVGDPATAPGRLHISGLGGEHYHKNNKAHRDLRVRDLDQAKKVFANWQQPMDPLRVQHGWVTDWQRSFLDHWVEERHEQGVPLDDLDEVAYAEFRLPLWAGTISSNTAGDVRFFPLVHPDLIALSYRGGVLTRQTQWLHFELIKRLHAPLTEVPFLGEGWDPRLRDELGADAPDVPPFVSSRRATSRNLVSWQWRFLAEEAQEIAECCSVPRTPACSTSTTGTASRPC
jgi:hypothetical protein